MSKYSFKDVTGNFNDTDVGTFDFAGDIGVGQFTVEMATDKSEHNVAADGAVMISAIAGDNGQVSVEVQQNSLLNTYLVDWYNAKKTRMMQNDVSTFDDLALTLRYILDGTTHVCRGITPLRLPAKVYAARGQMLTWTLLCADIQTMTMGES